MLENLDKAIPQMPLVAQIRKGSEKQMYNGQLIQGSDLKDRFRVVFAPGATAQDFQLFKSLFQGREHWAKVYGKGNKPMADRLDYMVPATTPVLKIFFPFPEVRKVWDCNIEVYSKSQLQGRGNESFWEFLRVDNKVLVRDFRVVTPHTDDLGQQFARGDKRPFNEMEVLWTDRDGNPIRGKVTAKMLGMIPGFGLRHFSIHTTSWNDVYRLAGQLSSISQVAQLAGKTLMGIPLYLMREPVEIRKRDKYDNVFRENSYLLTLRVAPEWEAEFLGEIAPAKYTHLLTPPAPILEDGEPEAGAEDADAGPLAEVSHTPADEPQVTPFVLPAWVKLTRGTVIEDENRLFYAVARQMCGLKIQEANAVRDQYNTTLEALEHLRTLAQQV